MLIKHRNNHCLKQPVEWSQCVAHANEQESGGPNTSPFPSSALPALCFESPLIVTYTGVILKDLRRKCSSGTGHLERLWSLLLRDLQMPPGRGPGHPVLGGPDGAGIGPDGLQRFLPTSAIL